jgi:alkaline phosphatase
VSPRRSLPAFALASCLAVGCTLDHDLGSAGPGGDDDDAGLLARDLPPPPRCGPNRSPQGAPRLPRNILFFLGDGMGVEHVAAGRALGGGTLRLDALSMVTVLNTDSTTTDRDPYQAPTDSAAGATAFATGTRVANGRLALGDDGTALRSVLDLAQSADKAVGLVTTSYLYDASAMAFAVHVSSRADYREITDQLLARPPIDVLMGGAAGLLDDAFIPWRTHAEAIGYRIVTSASELDALGATEPGFVLGLFTGHVDADVAYAFPTTPVLDRSAAATDPDLAQMTAHALARLERDPDGFFLLVENEHIDAYSHLSPGTARESAAGVPNEVLALDRAIGVGLDWVAAHSSFEDTLVLVTADHECGDYRHDDDAPLRGVFGSGAHTRAGVEAYASGPGTSRLAMLCRTSDLFGLLTGRPY